ncbi:DapH/DapD/GlmU-related protein [Paenibacillus sp. V4I7]|uniref:acyltransferase n=1 Tax=Paenibacillus sp. V4I7 TaxID=3042307 RepID=UPI002789B9B0|nr:acyltransferase [Paenibacillus sp. V4I7]MDQ0903913.1 acetyltransferase-like isoleucine patch superfamily enzyme [Paenibacillus sp. V4I7]
MLGIDVSKYLNKIHYYYRLLVTFFFYKLIAKHIGKKTVIYQPNLLSGLRNMSLGDRVIIFANSRIELIENYMNNKYKPNFVMGNDSQIHQNCHITCAGNISIGNNVIITANVTITDIIHPYEDTNMPINFQEIKVGEVNIGDQTYIYNNAVILPNVKIGKHCVIGANSLVNKNIPDYSVVVGNPARIIRQFDNTIKQWINYD